MIRLTMMRCRPVGRGRAGAERSQMSRWVPPSCRAWCLAAGSTGVLLLEISDQDQAWLIGAARWTAQGGTRIEL
jgi:hypothetical protein